MPCFLFLKSEHYQFLQTAEPAYFSIHRHDDTVSLHHSRGYFRTACVWFHPSKLHLKSWTSRVRPASPPSGKGILLAYYLFLHRWRKMKIVICDIHTCIPIVLQLNLFKIHVNHRRHCFLPAWLILRCFTFELSMQLTYHCQITEQRDHEPKKSTSAFFRKSWDWCFRGIVANCRNGETAPYISNGLLEHRCRTLRTSNRH